MALAQVETRAGKYVTFQLSRQYFAIRSDRVKQILPMSQVRSVQQRAPYLHGAIASNGRLIPVVDLRELLTSQARPARQTGSILVTMLEPSCPVSMVGLVVDKLSEVVTLRETDIRGNVAQMKIDGRPYGRPKTLVDVESLLQAEDWARISAVLL